jgi:hypothetical protein
MQSKRVTVEVLRTINAPIDRLWAEVANFNNLSAWHPDVTESQLQDAGAGATGYNPGEIRIIKLRDGSVLRERLVAIDPEAHRYDYSLLDGQLPLKDHISSLSMRAVDAFRTEVTWKASFEAADAMADILVNGVRSGVLELGLQGLEERVRQAA